jgi:hypothetical protein
MQGRRKVDAHHLAEQPNDRASLDLYQLLRPAPAEEWSSRRRERA